MAFRSLFQLPDLFLMQHPPPIPKLGQTRCYWALLSADLDFLYIDPVLRAHLGPQADPIVGKKLLEFVHPDEHASAHQDLGKVLESRTLHGSVTRVRYSRLGRVRARLGYTGVHQAFADEDKVSFDENYMACDLVINWAAEGLVLCFIHAVVDMSPQDNDENRRTHWTNWCGTPRMTDDHGTELYNALFHVAPQGAHGAPPPTRVFQILHNSTDRPTLFSWPPEGYHPADYGRLANDVQIGGANGSDAKTSCTRRYKAQQVLNSADGTVRDVESIFIPHGHIIFACHKATPHRPRGHPNSYPLYPTPAQFYDHPHAPPYYPPPVVPAPLEPYAAPHGYHPYPHAGGHHHHHHHHAAPAPAAAPAQPLAGPSSPSPRSSASPYPWPPPPPPPAAAHAPAPAAPAPAYPAPPPHALDQVPPPRRRATPEHAPARAGGNPPAGVSRCAACKSTSSPEWRKGPSGRKDLCNACGLRFSRARAKKEGVAVQRRRKDGAAAGAAGAGAGGSGSGSGGGGKRRGAGAAGGAEGGAYGEFSAGGAAPRGGAAAHGASPSPSPPGEYAAPAAGMYSYPAPHAHAPGALYMGSGASSASSSSSYAPPAAGAGAGPGAQNGYLAAAAAAPSSYERAHAP